MGIAVGIDLGTTNSCVAVVQGGHARVVENMDGHPIQPSVISFLPGGSVIAGHEAKNRMIVDPANTIYSFKRLLGRELSSAEIQGVIRDLTYEVLEGPGGIPVVRPTSGREVSLPEVSAMMLRHLREMACEVLGREITDAVITVPANFNDVQRSSTKVAGRIAGFNVLRILNEPTAAALAYGLGGNRAERIAVYDFGGGTFDITIIELQDDVYEVLSTAGDTFLGGDDFDSEIVAEMRGKLLRDHNVDIAGDQTASQRVRTVAERIKCQLSALDEVQATLREIAEGPDGPVDFEFSLTRKRLEAIIAPLIDRSLKTCEEALKIAKLDRSSLDNLILVGGTTRVPLVRRRVEEFFGREPLSDINPDEVVAIGAAIHAYSLTGEALPADFVMKRRARDDDPDAALPAPVKPVQRQPVARGERIDAASFGELGEPEVLDSALLEDLDAEEMGLEPTNLPAPKPKKDKSDSMPAALFGSIPAAAIAAPPSRALDTIEGEADFAPVDEEDRRSYAVPDSKTAVSTLLLDVTPKALGIATAGGYCDQIIERNAPIPIEQSRLFSTSTDNQTEVVVDVYQGESRRIADNAKLGNVVLAGIRPAARGEIRVRVTFEIDTDGILRVSARNEESGEAQRTRIQLTGGLSEDQVNDLVKKYAATGKK
jgi:molecular chaperone DnaK